MKIQPISDIHLDHQADNGDSFLKSLTPAPGVDLLIVAGDLANANRPDLWGKAYESFSKKWPHTLVVKGNHDFFGTKTKEEVMRASRLLLPKNVHLLDNEIISLGGKTFYGGTGWFPYSPRGVLSQSLMADFQLIPDVEKWIYDDRKTFKSRFEACDVAITHHVPHKNCISRQYWGSTLNDFFLGDFWEELDDFSPPLWVFGHTHDHVDINHFSSPSGKRTRMVCNPFGYPQEGSRMYKDGFTVEI